VGTREDVRIEVINPDNDEKAPGHPEFKKRMNAIFLKGHGSRLRTFSQIVDALPDPRPGAP
jgi:hypothetical protein